MKLKGYVLWAGDVIADDFVEFHGNATAAMERRHELWKEHPGTNYIICEAELHVNMKEAKKYEKELKRRAARSS